MKCICGYEENKESSLEHQEGNEPYFIKLALSNNISIFDPNSGNYYTGGEEDNYGLYMCPKCNTIRAEQQY